MSGSAAKLQRRELRKAVGEQAIAQLDTQTSVTNTLVDLTNRLAHQITDHSEQIAQINQTADERWVDTSQSLQLAHDRFGKFTRLTLRERVRWLLTGR